MITVIIDDVNPLVDIAGLLHTYGRSYRVQGETATTLSDLRRSPSVFIGAYDNGWTLRLTAPLRFHFANNQEMTRFWIEDRNNPTKQDWVIDRSSGHGDLQGLCHRRTASRSQYRSFCSRGGRHS